MPTSSRRQILGWCACLLIAGVLIGMHVWSHRPDGRVHILFLDIGQGDSALIITPSGKQIMIDGGPNLKTLGYLGSHMSFFDRSIDLLILSHPHLDHVASFPEILARYDVGHFLFAGTASKTGRYRAVLRELADNHPQAMIAEPGSSVDLGDGITFDVLWPPRSWYGKAVSNENNASVTGILRYKNHSVFFAGDSELPVERALLAMHTDLHAEVLKVGHHGSDTSSSEQFLRAVRPDRAVISVGEGNSFHHPKQDVLDRLDRLGIPYQRTDRDGTVEIVWE